MINRLPIGPRPLAVLLMVAGAAGFVAARVLFGEQVLCLLFSTLVTFGGLGIIIMARRKGWEQSWKDQHPDQNKAGERPLAGRHIPRGLRSARYNGRTPSAPSEVAQWKGRPQSQPEVSSTPATLVNVLRQEPYEPMPPLALRVMKILRQQGAQVVVDTRREDRSILQIHTIDGENYLALVLEEDMDVDVAELRALNALVNSSTSTGGYLITSGGFSQRALEWSTGKPLRLLTRDELGQLTI